MGASGPAPTGDNVPAELSNQAPDAMVAAHELARLCEGLGLSAEARAVIETIRSSPPAHRLRSAAGNVSVRYPSRKMGVTIQAESHRVELAAVYEYEHDAQVLEFYDQPAPIKLVYQAKHGRQLGVWHTPDYFVVRVDAIGWEEWKPEAGLERLAETMPNRYRRDEFGHWTCPPGVCYRLAVRIARLAREVTRTPLLHSAPKWLDAFRSWRMTSADLPFAFGKLCLPTLCCTFKRALRAERLLKCAIVD